MKKTNLILALSVLILVVVIVYFTNKNKPVTESLLSGPKDSTYTIAGQKITLKDGVSIIDSAPGSTSKITTQYFGNELSHDFDKDGRMDTTFLLTQNMGGTGTFYYLVAALNTVSGYVGSEAVLIGDRISPQTTEMGKGNIVIVNYADRNDGDDFSQTASVNKSMWLLLDTETMQFGEVVQNFEGEADTSKMNLKMKDWTWVSTELNDGSTITPKKPGKFVLTFKDNKNFSATTDCNGVGGEYTINGSQIKFDKMMSTQMYCEGSQEAMFSSYIQNSASYHFTSKGELILDLKFDNGSVIFR